MAGAVLERTEAESVSGKTHAIGASLSTTTSLILSSLALMGADWPGHAVLAAAICLTFLALVGRVAADRPFNAVYLVLWRYALLGMVIGNCVLYAKGFLTLWHGDIAVIPEGISLQALIFSSLNAGAAEQSFNLPLTPLIPFGIWLSAFLLMGSIFRFEQKIAAQRPTKVGSLLERLIKLSEFQVKEHAAAFANGLLVGKVGGRKIYAPIEERLIVAPPGSGKDTSVVLQTMLRHEGPIVGIDLKGTATAITGRFRITTGRPYPHRLLYVLDPLGVTKAKEFARPWCDLSGHRVYARFNPLEFITPGPPELIIARLETAVEGMISRGKENQGDASKHFENLSVILIKGLIWAGLEAQRNGWTVEGLEGEAISPAWVYRMMTGSVADPTAIIPWLRRSGGPAKEAATVLAAAGDRERGSIITTGMTMLSWLSDPNMQDVVSRTTIDFNMVMKGYADVQIVLPVNQTTSKAEWIHGLLRAFFSIHEFNTPANLPAFDKPVLYVLNELGQLGYVKALEESWSRLREFGGRLMVVFQGVYQWDLYMYKKMFEAAQVTQVFGVEDSETLKWIQDKAGKITVERTAVSEGINEGTLLNNRSGGVQGGRQVTQQEVDLLSPEVIRGLGKTRGLVFRSGVGIPVVYDQMHYFQDLELVGRFDDNPWRSSK